MKNKSVILIALTIVIAFAVPFKSNAGNPDQSNVTVAKQCQVLDANSACAPLTLINVSLQNSSQGNTICETCPTWYVSVWEDNGGTPVQIGAEQAYTLSPSTYKWPNITYDIPYCIYLVWRHVGSGCNPCPVNTIISYANCTINYPPSWTTFTDFYPPN
jgi:hypothetical protein